MANQESRPAGTLLDALQAKLQAMRERDLTTSVIVPLLKAAGYPSVVVHDGPDELGKDLVAWGKDRFGGPALAVAQVKMYKPARRVRHDRSFAGIVTQLSQAVETPVPANDGQMYLPSDVLFITPYEIDTRTLQSRFDGLKAISHRVRILAGSGLALRVQETLPHLVADLVGTEVQVKSAVISQLNNKALLAALQYGRDCPKTC